MRLVDDMARKPAFIPAPCANRHSPLTDRMYGYKDRLAFCKPVLTVDQVVFGRLGLPAEEAAAESFDRNQILASDPIDPKDPASWPLHAIRQPPFAAFMGARIVCVATESIEAELLVRPELLNRNGLLHGGAILAVADNLGGTFAFINLDSNQSSTTVESKTNFLRPVQPGDTVKFVCIALHLGRRTMVLQTSVYGGDGRLAAIVTQTQMVLAKDDTSVNPSSA